MTGSSLTVGYTRLSGSGLPASDNISSAQVLSTDPQLTLLRVPKGKNSILNVKADILDDAGRPVPLSRVYMHHFVMRESTGTPPEDVIAGRGWPDRYPSPIYSKLAEEGLSFSAGPCNSLPQTRGGGAEWRGVGAQLAFDASKPGQDKPAFAWVFDSTESTWGLNLHVIDLRGVDRCGAWEGNAAFWKYPDFPNAPHAGPYPCAPKGNASLMTGVSQCIQARSHQSAAESPSRPSLCASDSATARTSHSTTAVKADEQMRR